MWTALTRFHVFCAGCAPIVGLTLVSPAMAQTVPDRSIELGFELGLQADSNVARANAARAALRGLDRADLRVSPALTATIDYPIGPHLIEGNAYLGYDFYMRNPRLDAERLNLDGRAKLDFQICEVTPKVAFSRHRTEFENSGFLDPNGPLIVDNIEMRQTYGADVSCGRQVGLRPLAGIEYSKGDNSNELRRRSDFDATTIRVGVGYRQPTIGDIELYASRRQTNFPERAIGGVADRFVLRSVGASFQRDIGTRFTFDGDVSYADLSSRFGGNGFGGLNYSLGLSAIVSERLQLRGTFSKAIQTSLSNDANYTVTENYGINATYVLSPRLRLGAGYLLRKNDYTYSNTLGVLPANALNNDSLNSISSSLTYQRSDRLSFTLNGGYEKRNANGSFYDYSSAFVGLRARILLGS